MKKRYLALSLVEILFVLGGLIILGTIGLLGSRYALEKSREAHYKSNVKLIYASLVDFKNDFGRYPLIYKYPKQDPLNFPPNFRCTPYNGCLEQSEFIASALGFRGPLVAMLKPYFQGVFDGGHEASYYYYVQDFDGQFVIVCVSLGGINDRGEQGFYCEGDGIGVLPFDSPLPGKEIDPSNQPYYDFVKNNMDQSIWNGGAFSSL